MVSASQINDLIRSYLSGSLSLQRFAEAFESVYSEINVACEPHVLALGDHIQVLLGRLSSNYVTENDLRGWLQSLSQTFNSSANGTVVYDRPESTPTYSLDQGYLITA